MLTYLRYALAAVCFACCVGCLALWAWGINNYQERFIASRYHLATGSVVCQIHDGRATVAITTVRVRLSQTHPMLMPPTSIGGTQSGNLSSLTQPIRQKLSDSWYVIKARPEYPLILQLDMPVLASGRDDADGKAFGYSPRRVYFPLWYPALIFALTGVAVLRFRRQFSIRSALIGLTVVAALLGIAAIL